MIGDEEGWIREIECLEMKLGEPDDSGRRRPVPIKGSEFLLPVDAGNEMLALLPAGFLPVHSISHTIEVSSTHIAIAETTATPPAPTVYTSEVTPSVYSN